MPIRRAARRQSARQVGTVSPHYLCLWVMSRTTCGSVVFGVPARLANQRGEVGTVSRVPPSLAGLATSRWQAVRTVVLPIYELPRLPCVLREVGESTGHRPALAG